MIPWIIVAALLALFSVPSRANVAPESGLLAHVQSVSGTCETTITDCTQIVRSTTAEGEVEFILFFMRGAFAWPGESLCIQSLHNELSWPEAWQFVSFEVCGYGNGSLGTGGTTHPLDLSWYWYSISDQPNGVIPIARLVMNVVGPGQLDFASHYGGNPVVLQQNCYGATFNTYPVQVFAEAGVTCGHVVPHCAYHEFECTASFQISELGLIAPSGSAADSTIEFWAPSVNPYALCPLNVDTHASWCTAYIDPVW